ncbi:GPW/gp25 family protein [Chryseobacterium sp. MEBOG06]|uniref:GPW/gp25 family protein n=1 Tax=unclassified Chryseobacterium TaxID=2593645 RepID=UPI001F18EB4C|nr:MULTISPECIES: GPW/gp25 family protein [unclassified Chryseobacterium]UKB82417.1 GPW/gp25 family protein [Chryseobacterium sp. MEBOG06]
MKINTDFLGIGWSFPPEFNETEGKLAMTTDVEDINNSLLILLSTRPGERVMFPNYGCDLQEMLFKPLDLTLITQMTGIIERAILYHEPRINILSIDIDTQDELEGEVLIQIDYEVRNTNTRSNIVFPFYKGEATEI